MNNRTSCSSNLGKIGNTERAHFFSRLNQRSSRRWFASFQQHSSTKTKRVIKRARGTRGSINSLLLTNKLYSLSGNDTPAAPSEFTAGALLQAPCTNTGSNFSDSHNQTVTQQKVGSRTEMAKRPLDCGGRHWCWNFQVMFSLNVVSWLVIFSVQMVSLQGSSALHTL